MPKAVFVFNDGSEQEIDVVRHESLMRAAVRSVRPSRNAAGSTEPAPNSFGQRNSPSTQAAPIANFFVAGNADDRGGVRVAVKDADRDIFADVVAGSGEGGPSRVRAYLGRNFSGASEPAAFQDIDPFGAALPGGVFVG